MTIRIVTFILAAIFVASGGAKLASLQFELDAFSRWGYSLPFMYLVGALEVAGAIGLLVRRLSALASISLAGLMVGAVATHVVHAEWPMLAVAGTITALAAWRGWAGRGEIMTLFARNRA